MPSRRDGRSAYMWVGVGVGEAALGVVGDDSEFSNHTSEQVHHICTAEIWAGPK